MSVLTHAATVTSPDDLLDAVDVFWSAHYAAEAVRNDLTSAQSAGPDPLPLDLERLDGEARAAYNAMLTTFGIDGDDDVFGSLADLYARPRFEQPAATSMSDWSRGRTT